MYYKPAMRLVLGVAAVVCLLVPARGSAATFEGDGTFVFDPSAVFTESFEDPALPVGAGSIEEDEGALTGSNVLSLAPFQGADVQLTLPETASEYRVTAWIRDAETVVDLVVRYADNPHEGIDEFSVLYPTGRMTSDGWIELSNDHVRVDGTRGATVTFGFFSVGSGSVDALEIVRVRDLSAPEKTGEHCDGSADPVCGESHVCLFNQCRYVGGGVPNIPADRDDVAAYLGNRLRQLFGPMENRKLDLPHAEFALQSMQTATTPWGFWNGFTLAVRRLHDGHTGTSGIGDFILENERPLGLCFIEGDADLSQDAAPSDDVYLDVLVSHTAGSRTLGLVAGDRLVRVDGLHPIAWARAQVEHHWSMSTASNHSTFAEHVEGLRGLVARYADTIDVVRCDAATSTCGAAETIVLADLPPLAPGEMFQSVQCDNRPLRHLPTSPADHAGGGDVLFGVALESTPAERIYTTEFDSLYATSLSNGVSPGLKAAITAFEADAGGVILDHRTGNGGTLLPVEILWDFAVPSHPVSFYEDRRFFDQEQPSLADGLAIFQKAIDDGTVDIAGSSTPTALPVALLITRDVSASDWLPLGLKGAAPNVKIFGPFQTSGGFSTLYSFAYWFGVNWQIAVGETWDATGMTRGGRGVEPDVVVRPKQSDLLLGQDTVFETALAWVRQEITP